MINPFNVSYPDFKVGEIIFPDELDVNFADIGIRINQILDVLNRITDGIGGTGTGIIHVGDVLPFTSANLQVFLDELLTKLQSEVPLDSGAGFIGASFIQGVSGNTVQEQLESLKNLLDVLDAREVADTAFLNGRIDGQISTISNMDTRLIANEAEVDTKANASDVYTIAQSDIELAQLEAQVYNDIYTKAQADVKFNLKTNNTGNHVGTWQGINISNLSGVLGITNTVIDVVQPPNPTENLLWFNPTNQQYTIYRGGKWRFNGIPSKLTKKTSTHVLPVDFVTTVPINIAEFHKDYDVLLVFKNTVLLPDSEYTINSTSTSITLTDGTVLGGTTFNIVAMISVPVSGSNGSSRISELEARITALETP